MELDNLKLGHLPGGFCLQYHKGEKSAQVQCNSRVFVIRGVEEQESECWLLNLRLAQAGETGNPRTMLFNHRCISETGRS